MVPSRLPKLNTELTQPLYALEKLFFANCETIKKWFHAQWQLTPPPVYGSVDLRNAGFKLAPIDMNLFPAGFNNLNPDFFSTSVAAAEKAIHRVMPQAKRILIIPESHSRNAFYWSNIQTLKKILSQAEFDVRLGTLSGDIKAKQGMPLPSGDTIMVEPLIRVNGQLSVEQFQPDLVLLNNDLSDGIPEILQNLKQPLVPPAELGWSQRLKSDHFQYYAEVVAEFAETMQIDPWLIAPLFRHCGKIDFMQQDGMECLIHHAEELFASIEKKYAEYHIPYQPFLIIKADAGTYGMAVMTVRHVDELRHMNRKQRTRMSTTKGGQAVTRVIIQEGVYTFETLGDDQSVAEPVVYLLGDSVIGGFYRVHKERGVDENLNAPGMHFEPLAFQKRCDEPCETMDHEHDTGQNRFYLYGVIAQLSMLAAAREMRDQVKST